MRAGTLAQQLYAQMVVAIIAGLVIGHFWPQIGVALAPIGIGFVKAMRMMVPPILFCTIVDGIVSHGGARRTGSLIVRSLLLFLAVTVVAIFIGLFWTLVLRPGAGLQVARVTTDRSLVGQLAVPATDGPGGFLLRIIPDTFFSAFTAGEVLQVLFIACLVGFGLLRIGQAGDAIARAVRSLARLQFAIIAFVIRAAPLGALGSVAFTVGAYGIAFIGSLGMLVMTVFLACLSLVIALLGAVWLIAEISPSRLLTAFREELLIILGTASTEVVLPRMIQKLERLGCPPRIVGLVIPLGYSLNLAGTAVYLVIATLFLSEALHISLPPDRVALYLLTILVTSKTAAGVAGSGFSALLLTLSLLPDIPAGAAATLIAADRFVSVLRALTSGIANISAAVLLSRWEGALSEPEHP